MAGVCVRADAGEGVSTSRSLQESVIVAGAGGGNSTGGGDVGGGGQGRELGALEWGEWLEHGSEGEFGFCALVGGVGGGFGGSCGNAWLRRGWRGMEMRVNEIGGEGLV